MKKFLLATSAIALLATIGTAEAGGGVNIGDKTYNQGGTGVGVGIAGAGAEATQGDTTTGDVRVQQKTEVPAQAPAIVLAQPGVGAAVATCVIGGGEVEGRAFGLGAGTGSNDLPSAGLGYAYTVSDGLFDVQCGIGNSSNLLMNAGLEAEARTVLCLDTISRRAMDKVNPATCAGMEQMTAFAFNTDEATFVTVTPPAPAVAPAPQPVAAVAPPAAKPAPDFSKCDSYPDAARRTTCRLNVASLG